MATKKALRKGDRRWQEFLFRLEGPEGCKFMRLDREHRGSTAWSCPHILEKPLSQAVLKAMGGFDVEETLRYFESHGGFCDCLVLFNVPYD